MTIKWDEIVHSNQVYFTQVMQLYDDMFPLDVREPHAIFQQGLKYAATSAPNTFRFLVGIEEPEVVSFATAHYMSTVNCGFIVYIATNPSSRSRGLGSQTLLQVEKVLHRDAIRAGHQHLGAMVLETEQAEFVHSLEEQEDCIKRNRFFQRNGYKLTPDIDYVQPPLRDGGKAIPLNLFVKNFRDSSIGLPELRQIVVAMYREKYQAVNALDREVLTGCLHSMRMSEIDL